MKTLKKSTKLIWNNPIQNRWIQVWKYSVLNHLCVKLTFFWRNYIIVLYKNSDQNNDMQ